MGFIGLFLYLYGIYRMYLGIRKAKSSLGSCGFWAILYLFVAQVSCDIAINSLLIFFIVFYWGVTI